MSFYRIRERQGYLGHLRLVGLTYQVSSVNGGNWM
jgi:hypothetical protein